MRPSQLAGVIVALIGGPAFAGGPSTAGGGWVLLGDGDVAGGAGFVEHELALVRHLSLVPRAGLLFASRTQDGFGAGRIWIDGVVVASSAGHTIYDQAWSAFADLDLLFAITSVGNLRLGAAAGPSLRYLSHVRPTVAGSSLNAQGEERFWAHYQHDRLFHPGVSLGLRTDLNVAGALVGLRSSFYRYTQGTTVLMVAVTLGVP